MKKKRSSKRESPNQEVERKEKQTKAVHFVTENHRGGKDGPPPGIKKGQKVRDNV